MSILRQDFFADMRDALPSSHGATKESDSTEIAIILKAIANELEVVQDQIQLSRDSTFYWTCRADALYDNLGFILGIQQESWQSTESYRNLLQGTLRAILARPSLEGIRSGLETFIDFRVELEARSDRLAGNKEPIAVEDEINLFTFDVRVVIPDTASVSLAQEYTKIIQFITRVKPHHTFFYQAFVFEENFQILRRLIDRDWQRINWTNFESIGDCVAALQRQHYFVLNRLISHLNGREDILICTKFNCVLTDELTLLTFLDKPELFLGEFSSDKTARVLDNDDVEKIISVTSLDGSRIYDRDVHWRSNDRSNVVFTLARTSGYAIADSQKLKESNLVTLTGYSSIAPPLFLAENVDYTVDYENGVFTRVTSGSIDTEDEIIVRYAYPCASSIASVFGIYVDVDSSYSGLEHEGTTLDPWSWDQFIAYSIRTGDYFYFRGTRQDLSVNFYGNAAFTIDAWDISLYGPWRLVINDTDNLRATYRGGYLEADIVDFLAVENMFINAHSDLNGSNDGALINRSTVVGASVHSLAIRVFSSIIENRIVVPSTILVDSVVTTRADSSDFAPIGTHTFTNISYGVTLASIPAYDDSDLRHFDIYPGFGVGALNGWALLCTRQEKLQFRSGGVAKVLYQTNARGFVGTTGFVSEVLDFSEKGDEWINFSVELTGDEEAIGAFCSANLANKPVDDVQAYLCNTSVQFQEDLDYTINKEEGVFSLVAPIDPPSSKIGRVKKLAYENVSNVTVKNSNLVSAIVYNENQDYLLDSVIGTIERIDVKDGLGLYRISGSIESNQFVFVSYDWTSGFVSGHVDNEAIEFTHGDIVCIGYKYQVSEQITGFSTLEQTITLQNSNILDPIGVTGWVVTSGFAQSVIYQEGADFTLDRTGASITLTSGTTIELFQTLYLNYYLTGPNEAIDVHCDQEPHLTATVTGPDLSLETSFVGAFKLGIDEQTAIEFSVNALTIDDLVTQMNTILVSGFGTSTNLTDTTAYVYRSDSLGSQSPLDNYVTLQSPTHWRKSSIRFEPPIFGANLCKRVFGVGGEGTGEQFEILTYAPVDANSVTVRDVRDFSGYVEDVDWAMDYDVGFFYRLFSGLIGPEDEVFVSYSVSGALHEKERVVFGIGGLPAVIRGRRSPQLDNMDAEQYSYTAISRVFGRGTDSTWEGVDVVDSQLLAVDDYQEIVGSGEITSPVIDTGASDKPLAMILWSPNSSEVSVQVRASEERFTQFASDNDISWVEVYNSQEHGLPYGRFAQWKASLGGIDSSLLLHGEGDSGSSDIVDSGLRRLTSIVNTGITVDSSQKKFGASSLNLSSGLYLDYDRRDDWDLNYGDRTIDFWIRFSAIGPSHMGIAAFFDGSTTWQWVAWVSASGELAWIVYDSGGTPIFLFDSGTMLANTWYHVAFVKSGSSLLLFRDGILVDSTTLASFQAIATGVLELGRGQYDSFSGWIDEFRITDSAQWTSNFTPPSQAYADTERLELVQVSWRYNMPSISEDFLLSDVNAGALTFPIANGSVLNVDQEYLLRDSALFAIDDLTVDASIGSNVVSISISESVKLNQLLLLEETLHVGIRDLSGTFETRLVQSVDVLTGNITLTSNLENSYYVANNATLVAIRKSIRTIYPNSEIIKISGFSGPSGYTSAYVITESPLLNSYEVARGAKILIPEFSGLEGTDLFLLNDPSNILNEIMQLDDPMQDSVQIHTRPYDEVSGWMIVTGFVSGQSYIFDDFSGGVYDPWWNTDYTSTHSLVQYPPVSGYYVAVRGISDWRTLFPAGSSACGDFDLKWQIVLGANNNDNVSVHFALYDVTETTGICELEWFNGNIVWSWPLATSKDSVSAPFIQYQSYWLRLVRVGSTITAYYDIGSGWVALSSPTTYSGCVTVQEEGATRHGIGTFDFRADSGFPNSDSTFSVTRTNYFF